MRRSLRDCLAGVGRWPRLLAAAACLLLAALGALGAAHRNSAPSRQRAVDTVQVVVAARDLPAGRRLTRRDLTDAAWPRALRPPGSTGHRAARVGARLAGPLRRGEPVTDTRLVGASLTRGLPTGVAAVPVAVSDPHTTDLLHPGMHVELFTGPRSDLDSAASTANRSPDVVASSLLVLVVLPGSDETGASIVVAADPEVTTRIVAKQSTYTFFAVPISP